MVDGDVGERQGAHDQLVLLHGVHAAELGAERVVHRLVAGAGAHHVGDALGHLAVAGPQDRVERPRRRQQAVHLHAGDDVLVCPEAVLRLEVGIEELEAGGHDHGADLDVELALLHPQVDGEGRAGGDALPALGADAAVEAAPGTGEGLLLGHRRLELDEAGRAARNRRGNGGRAVDMRVRLLPREDLLPCPRPAVAGRTR